VDTPKTLGILIVTASPQDPKRFYTLSLFESRNAFQTLGLDKAKRQVSFAAHFRQA